MRRGFGLAAATGALLLLGQPAWAIDVYTGPGIPDLLAHQQEVEAECARITPQAVVTAFFNAIPGRRQAIGTALLGLIRRTRAYQAADATHNLNRIAEVTREEAGKVRITLSCYATGGGGGGGLAMIRMTAVNSEGTRINL